jgi:hypothetical protein
MVMATFDFTRQTFDIVETITDVAASNFAEDSGCQVSISMAIVTISLYELEFVAKSKRC